MMSVAPAQCSSELPKQRPCLFLREPSAFGQNLEELASFHIFHDEIDIARVLKNLAEIDKVWMMQ